MKIFWFDTLKALVIEDEPVNTQIIFYLHDTRTNIIGVNQAQPVPRSWPIPKNWTCA